MRVKRTIVGVAALACCGLLGGVAVLAGGRGDVRTVLVTVQDPDGVALGDASVAYLGETADFVKIAKTRKGETSVAVASDKLVLRVDHAVFGEAVAELALPPQSTLSVVVQYRGNGQAVAWIGDAEEVRPSLKQGRGARTFSGADDCASADPISGDGVFFFDNTGATTDGPPHSACLFFGSDDIFNDVWFCWTADCDGTVTVDTCGQTLLDTKIAAYDGCACPPTDADLLDCNDDACGLQSSVTFSAVGGNTYLIRIGSFSAGASGTGTFTVATSPLCGASACTQDPSNCTTQNQANAFNSDVVNFITVDDFTPATTGDLTDICWWGTYFDGSVDCNPGTDNFTVRYYACNKATGLPSEMIDEFSQAGGTLTVSGPVDTGLLIAGFLPEYSYSATHAAVAVTAGQSYWIEISNDLAGLGFTCSWFWELATGGNDRAVQDGSPPDGYDSGDIATSDLAFCINVGFAGANCEAPAPANDLCQDAIGPLDIPSTTPGSTELATVDNFPFCGTSNTSPGVWYTVTGNGETITADLCNGATSYDAKLTVYCGDCNDPVCVTGNDDFCGFQSQVSWCSQAGAEYLILVHGFGGATGPFELTLSSDGVPCTGGVQCLPEGACCVGPDCIVTTEPDCTAQGGEYQGDGTSCGDVGAYPTAFDDCNNPFEDISGTGTQLFLGDDAGQVVPIGFAFNFYGDEHTDIAVCSNGYLTFGVDLTDFTNDPIPNTTDPDDFIAPLWDDLNPTAAGTVHYQTLGSAPNRRFIAQWTNVPQFGGSDSNTFQAILFEGSNCIEFRYGTFRPQAIAGDYTVGIENQDGTDGVSIDAATLSPGDCKSICPEVSESPCVLRGSLDIKPGSCPNPLNRRSRGVVPVALLGTADLDVTDVDQASLRLSRADGVGGEVAPLFGPPGPHPVFEDVATPFFGDAGDCCHELGADGLVDLSLKFSTEELVAALELDGLSPGDELDLVLTGTLTSGRAFVASDCVVLVPPVEPTTLSVSSNAADAYIQVTPVDLTTDGDGFADFARTFDAGTAVTLTAPGSHNGQAFARWKVNGVLQPAGQRTIQVVVQSSLTAQAVFRTWSSESTPLMQADN